MVVLIETYCVSPPVCNTLSQIDIVTGQLLRKISFRDAASHLTFWRLSLAAVAGQGGYPRLSRTRINLISRGITCDSTSLLILDSTLRGEDAFYFLTMATYPTSFLTSRLHSGDGIDLTHIKSMGLLLAALHTHLRAITTPLTYEQLQKNENVCTCCPTYTPN